MTTIFEQFRDDATMAETYAQEAFVIDILERIAERMEQSGVNRSQLAKKLGTSTANITQTLRGTKNLSTRTLARIAHALGGVPEFRIAEPATSRSWAPVIITVQRAYQAEFVIQGQTSGMDSDRRAV
jgi:transcriptional regulator with XRE-family HTH domain